MKLSDEQDTISPTRLLRMGVEHRVPQWISPAFIKLASSPLHTQPSVSLDMIPRVIVSELLSVQRATQAVRQGILEKKPPIYSSRISSKKCKGHQCVDLMNALWDSIAEPLFRGADWYPAAKVHNSLFVVVETTEICSPCVSTFRYHYGRFLGQEEALIREAANNLTIKMGFGGDY